MKDLALIEGRKAARNPVLWLGAALVVAVAWLNARSYWPVVPDDQVFAYEAIVVLASFALLCGGWVGLRDRATGAEALIGSTPAAARGLIVPARAGALFVVAFASYLAVALSVVVISMARGGHGSPDPFLIIDAALYVALAACAGFALGVLTGSRILVLLAAPLLPGIDFYLQGRLAGRITHAMWLLPSPRPPARYAHLGFLPDIFPIHALYLLGLIACTIAVLSWVNGRRARIRGAVIGGAAFFVVASSATLASAWWLTSQPEEVYVFGPDESQWVSIDDSGAGYRRMARMDRAVGAYPDDGSASECARSGDMTVCVLPEFGADFAQLLADDFAKLSPFVGFKGLRTKARMIPTSMYSGWESCEDDDEILIGSNHWMPEFDSYPPMSATALHCAIYTPSRNNQRASDAVHAWAYNAVLLGYTGDELDGAIGQWGGGVTRVARAMSDLPVDEVVTRLDPIWEDLRRGKVTLAELEAVMRK